MPKNWPGLVAAAARRRPDGGDGRMAATTFGREATVIGNLDKPYPLVTGSA